MIDKKMLKTFSKDVQFNFDLSSKHPFKKKAGRANAYYQLAFDESLDNDLVCLSNLYRKDVPFKIFGKETNLYITDNGYNGLFVDISPKMSRIELDEKTEKFIVTANTTVYEFVNHAMRLGYDFAEFAGLPGMVGAGVVGNAGYTPSGKFFSDFVKEIEVFDFETAKTLWLSPDENFFSLRESFIKQQNQNRTRYFVKRVVLKSVKRPIAEIKEKFDKQMSARKLGLKFGFLEGSAGSLWIFAKIKKITGKSFKDMLAEHPEINENFNGATFSENGNRHFVTSEKTTDKDVAKLLFHTKTKVKEIYGVDLEKEIMILDYDGEINFETFLDRNLK